MIPGRACPSRPSPGPPRCRASRGRSATSRSPPAPGTRPGAPCGGDRVERVTGPRLAERRPDAVPRCGRGARRPGRARSWPTRASACPWGRRCASPRRAARRASGCPASPTARASQDRGQAGAVLRARRRRSGSPARRDRSTPSASSPSPARRSRRSPSACGRRPPAVRRARPGPAVEVLDRDHAADADAGDPRAAGRDALVAIFGVMGGIAGAIALFVVAGTFGLAIAQRRRETAVLRALGATPRQVRRLVAAEALIVAAAASALGVLAGGPLARALADALADHGAAPQGFAPGSSWVPLAAAVGLGVGVSQLAVVAAAWRAGRVRPAEALREVAVEHGRPGAGARAGRPGLPRRRRDIALAFSGEAALAFAILAAMLLAGGYRAARALAARAPRRRARPAAPAVRRPRAPREPRPGRQPLAQRGARDADPARRDAGGDPGRPAAQRPARHAAGHRRPRRRRPCRRRPRRRAAAGRHGARGRRSARRPGHGRGPPDRGVPPGRRPARLGRPVAGGRPRGDRRRRGRSTSASGAATCATCAGTPWR